MCISESNKSAALRRKKIYSTQSMAGMESLTDLTLSARLSRGRILEKLPCGRRILIPTLALSGRAGLMAKLSAKLRIHVQSPQDSGELPSIFRVSQKHPVFSVTN